MKIPKADIYQKCFIFPINLVWKTERISLIQLHQGDNIVAKWQWLDQDGYCDSTF